MDASDFVGTGKRLTAADYRDDAQRLGVPVATILGVVEVEAAGSGFDARNRPTILFEPHIFWRELGPGAKRDQAAALGVAYATWGARPYPRTSDENYARLLTAVRIDEEAGLRSASYGLCQIMGFHADQLGYATARALFDHAKLGENEQLEEFTSYVVAENLGAYLVRRDAAGFARRYNGPGFAKNRYDAKLAEAWAKYDARSGSVPDRDPSAGVDVAIRSPLTTAWKHLQAALNDLRLPGTPLEVDGDPGPKTLAAAKGLVPKIEAAMRGEV